MAGPNNLGKRVMLLVQSIRFRITLWFTAILALVLLVFSIFVYYNQARDIGIDDLSRLEHKMTALEATILLSPNGIMVPDGVLQDTDVFVFLSSDGQVIASKGPLSAQQVIQMVINAQQEQGRYSGPTIGLGNHRPGNTISNSNYIFVAAPVTYLNQNGYFLLGTLADPYGLSSRLIFTLLIGCLLTLAIALAGGFWLADRAMRPVKTITQAARTIGETDLNRRLNLKSKDELGELANTFDAMLARLQTAFERQRQFVADASHELRTPLTIVNLETSRALAAHRSTPEYQRALSVIHGENDFMSRLVNDLLTLARMDAGQAAIEMVPVDLSDIALEAIDRFEGLASRNGVRIEAGELPEAPLRGDRQYLLQMISNLVENAIKYTTGEAKKVCIETGVEDGSAWVRISDNGPGIASEHLAHLFDRFYRVDKARTRDDNNGSQSAGGSGLGLSIVQWIARAHGGDVMVESTVGSGTTFEVRFKTV
jgi:heavy metal sensor kinase